MVSTIIGILGLIIAGLSVESEGGNYKRANSLLYLSLSIGVATVLLFFTGKFIGVNL